MKATAGDRKRDRWSLDGERGIIWRIGDPASEPVEPHEELVEMGGRRVWMAICCGVDAEGQLQLSREIHWLVAPNGQGRERGEITRSYGVETAAKLTMDGEKLGLGRVERIRFDGTLTIEHAAVRGVAVSRTFFPSMKEAVAFEKWTLRSRKREECRVEVAPFVTEELESGSSGEYVIETFLRDLPSSPLSAGGFHNFGLVFRTRRAAEAAATTSLVAEERDRKHFVSELRRTLLLETPDRALNRAFEIAKLRVTEEAWISGSTAPALWSSLVAARSKESGGWTPGYVPSPSASLQYAGEGTRSLFGIVETGARSFHCAPEWPNGWDRMALRHISLSGEPFDLVVERTAGGSKLTLEREEQTLFSEMGVEFEVPLPPSTS